MQYPWNFQNEKSENNQRDHLRFYQNLILADFLDNQQFFHTISIFQATATPKKQKKKRERPPPDPTDPAVIAAKAADHNKNLEAEQEALKAKEDDSKPSKLEECKYYTSLTLGTLCIVSVFAFLFLVPFVLDPAISTMTHDFKEEPVTCKVSNVAINHGKSNCKWSSCREGCTADMYHCYQVRVIYSHVPYRNGTPSYYVNDWVDLERFDTIENKVRWLFVDLFRLMGKCNYFWKNSGKLPLFAWPL